MSGIALRECVQLVVERKKFDSLTLHSQVCSKKRYVRGHDSSVVKVGDLEANYALATNT